jgi:hypothetical protein
LKENRIDDAKEEVIRQRWDVYERETFPVLEHYPQGIIREVDAFGSPASVLQHILEHVGPVQAAHFANPIGGDPSTAPRAKRGRAPSRSVQRVSGVSANGTARHRSAAKARK